MTGYVIKRLLSGIITVLGITVVVFAVARLAPGDAAALAGGAGGQLNADDTQAGHRRRIELYGLHRPVYIQYGQWLGRAARLDFGDSIKHHRPVIGLIAERLPVTLVLNLIALTLVYCLSVPMGILAAVKRGGRLDRLMSLILLALWSLPIIWVGQIWVGYFGGPTARLSPGRFDWAGYVGPVVCLTYTGFAYLTKQVRASVLENLHADYVRTARAKGLSETSVLLGHVLPNSLIPLTTVAATILPALIGGSVIVEKVFGIPGMGLLMFEAVANRDYNVVMAVATIAGILNCAGLLLADIAYAVVDPRVDFANA